MNNITLKVYIVIDIKKEWSDIAMILIEFVDKQPEIAKIFREGV